MSGPEILSRPCRKCGLINRSPATSACLPCARVRRLAWGLDDPERVRRSAAASAKRRRPWKRRSIVQRLLEASRARARKKNLTHTLGRDDVRIPETCPVLGIRLCRSSKKGPCASSPSLDRIDNTKGYIPGNVVVVSYKVNRIKNDATVSELRAVLQFYERQLSI